jgi:1-phosphofructokinase family hexose kinase
MIYTLTLNPAVDRELTVPAIEFDSVLRATESRVDCGGKGFNVARMLAALGSPSTAVGFAGGKAGELLGEMLAALGIGVEFIPVQGETRTNVSIVSPAEGRYVKANEPGPRITPAEEAALFARVGALARPGDWWVLAGSLPPGVEADIYARLITRLKAAGAGVLLDTSGAALAHGCDAGPFLAKPNALEAGQLTGLPVETRPQLAAAARSILGRGVGNVVVSLGKDGALLVTPEGEWAARSPRIRESNPIGAGDSLVGGLVWGLQAGLPLPEALRWGIACGAATASLPGTAVGTRALVEELVEKVEIASSG